MSYRSAMSGRILLVRWEDVPEERELDVLLADLISAQTRLGQKLFYVAVVGAHVDVPSGVRRHALARFGERATRYVEETHLVLEGEGFKHSVQRSVVTGMYFLKTGTGKVHIHKQVSDAIALISKSLGRPESDIARDLRSAGSLTA